MGRIRWVKTDRGIRLVFKDGPSKLVRWDNAKLLANWINENMPKMWEPKPLDVLEGWIDAILEEASDELSDWETGFMDSISERVKIKRRQLTQPQEETLERIYTNKTK